MDGVPGSKRDSLPVWINGTCQAFDSTRFPSLRAAKSPIKSAQTGSTGPWRMEIGSFWRAKILTGSRSCLVLGVHHPVPPYMTLHEEADGGVGICSPPGRPPHLPGKSQRQLQLAVDSQPRFTLMKSCNPNVVLPGTFPRDRQSNIAPLSDWSPLCYFRCRPLHHS